MTDHNIAWEAEEFAMDYMENNNPGDYEDDGLGPMQMMVVDAAEAGYIAGWRAAADRIRIKENDND